MLNDQVLPWFEQQEVKVSRVLSDRSSEYCGTLSDLIAVDTASYGKTPLQTFRDTKHLADQKRLDKLLEEAPPASQTTLVLSVA